MCQLGHSVGRGMRKWMMQLSTFNILLALLPVTGISKHHLNPQKAKTYAENLLQNWVFHHPVTVHKWNLNLMYSGIHKVRINSLRIYTFALGMECHLRNIYVHQNLVCMQALLTSFCCPNNEIGCHRTFDHQSILQSFRCFVWNRRS